MSRVAAANETVVVPPDNDIYTVLSGIALFVVILGLLVLYFRANTLMGGLF